MILFVKDRLYIPALLPRDNTFQEFSLKKSILSKVALAEEYQKKIGLTQKDENSPITWDSTKDTGVEVKFTTEECAYLKDACELVLENKMPDDMWQVISRIYECMNEAINN